MKSLGIGCLVLVGLVVLGALSVVFTAIGTYNGLVNTNNDADKAWGNVEATLQRRNDLVPNLVNVVKGYTKHEGTTLVAVTEARAKVGQINIKDAAADPEVMKKFMAAQGELSSALSRLMVVVEKYPDLKADKLFLDLQAQLEGTENRISVARQRFNEAATDYNKRVEGFPGFIVAPFGGFQKRPLFEAEAGAKKAPVVKFD